MSFIILRMVVESMKETQACLLRSGISTILIERIEYTGIVAQHQRLGAVGAVYSKLKSKSHPSNPSDPFEFLGEYLTSTVILSSCYKLSIFCSSRSRIP
jgi:hypothetical protein